MTNSERVGKALNELKEGLAPFLIREFENRFQQAADSEARRAMGDYPTLPSAHFGEWDVAPQLSLIIQAWQDVFRQVLGPADRSYCYSLREVRRKWAHQESFTSDDTYRALDDVERLLLGVGAAQQASAVGAMKDELLRKRFEESRKTTERRKSIAPVKSGGEANLKPWREIITPHADVMRGNYQQAEFAADLWQVHIGQGTPEYSDPKEFYRRTFLTESLKQLLKVGMKRFSDGDGDPVIQLQTNFGGGKTHSMLALYHLFSGASAQDLLGVEDVMSEASVASLPKAKRVVLVGNKISPGNPTKKADGTVVRTLWGELAYQLGGKEAFARISEDDVNATNPGDALRELFDEYGPCLILIDEWVAYARQLHDAKDLPAGDFETQFSFAQALSESAKLSKNCLLVVSLPASDTGASGGVDDIEVGGVRGRQALDRLRNVMGRLDTAWRPASAEEGFEIVRRRLFQPLEGDESYRLRDVTARKFAEMYAGNPTEFPSDTGDKDYEERLQRAFPIHPEVFDRLYGDWSSLVKFQRTRGVLRLMATVIHELWREEDKNPLILPAHFPIDSERVNFELTRYLSDNWRPIIDKDVDGPASMPMRFDEQFPNLGRFSASRKVARTIFIGSAPKEGTGQRGIEVQRINIGSILPGEQTSIFSDALRRMVGGGTYLYHESGQYWYDTQPTIAKLARERAEQLAGNPDRIYAEVERRVKTIFSQNGGFSKIHVFPKDSSDIQDDTDLRLVVMSPDYPHSKGSSTSPGKTQSLELLENRGNAPRVFRNTLIFLCADAPRKEELEEAVRTYLAWKDILDDQDRLDLPQSQIRQVESQIRECESNMVSRIPECYQRLLIPAVDDPKARDIEWKDSTISIGTSAAADILKKLERDEVVPSVMGGNVLRMKLDGVPLWRGNHVEIKLLAEDFAKYLYLPKLKSHDVLMGAIEKGVNSISWESDGFAYAEDYDEQNSRYINIKAGQGLGLFGGGSMPGLLVRPNIASEQINQVSEEEKAGDDATSLPTKTDESASNSGHPNPQGGGVASTSGGAPDAKDVPKPTRYYASVSLNSLRVGRDAGQIAEEVIGRLIRLEDADVTITLEIQADLPQGIADADKRVISENGNTLGFDNHGFEDL